MDARLGSLGMEIAVVGFQLDLSVKSSEICRNSTYRAELLWVP